MCKYVCVSSYFGTPPTVFPTGVFQPGEFIYSNVSKCRAKMRALTGFAYPQGTGIRSSRGGVMHWEMRLFNTPEGV
jgi:hypothetical protein